MFGTMLRAVFLLLALGFSAFAEDYAFVKPNDFWRVLPYSTNNPAEPKDGWTQVDYDDSTWANLQAGFVSTFSGFPGTAEQSILQENVTSYCFRDLFTISDPSFVQWLSLRVNYESGFVAYINGTEVARRSFPADLNPVPLGAIASVHVRGPTETINVSSAIPNLHPGTNILAIQLHSAGTNLPSFLLVPELVANFTRGPMVEDMTSNSVQVIWRTDPVTTGYVEYGKDLDHLVVTPTEALSQTHAPILTNLEPGQSYMYRVYAKTDTQTATNDWASFTTLKLPSPSFTFLVVGDTGQGLLPQFQIADQMKARPADLLVHVGDILYPGFSENTVDARCFSVYREQMRSTPYFFCLGNHDDYFGGLAFYMPAVYMPTNSATGSELFYSFDHADGHFIILDTDTEAGQRYDPDSVQYKWLEADLAATTQPWKFIFFHHAFRSSSLHGWHDDYQADGILDRLELQEWIGGLASRYGAQIVFNGHDHTYERFAALNGVNSFVTGGGGARLYAQYYLDAGSAQFYSRHNFLYVTVDGPELKVDAIDQDGVVFDHLYRSQAPAGPGPFAAAWGSPVIESIPGTNFAGNIPNQTFNFSGDSMRTKIGAAANLGRIHVSNDNDFLYIGFEDSSIWTNQVVALFLENALQPGVTNLANLGNGVLDDANGEGVDGLDLLTNVDFLNFRPTVACLLGDQGADANLRNFKRGGMRWATGQGVFRLDQNFSSVDGARLQQFHRSPEAAATPPFFDENADFIEVAVPLIELGNPQAPGSSGQVRLGAIVFSDPGVTNITMQLDTAFAGAAFESADNGHFLLEPTTIQLAADPNPFHDAFEFRLTGVSDTALHFEWNSAAGVTYTIQSSSALGQPFEDINTPGLPIVANAAKTSFDLPIDGSSPRFYRLRTN
jgi:3',5'-cyclic AMP phosphodiesterase CpdA